MFPRYASTSPTAGFGSLAGTCRCQKTELELRGPPSQSAADGWVEFERAKAKYCLNNNKARNSMRCGIKSREPSRAVSEQLSSQLIVCKINSQSNLCAGQNGRISVVLMVH